MRDFFKMFFASLLAMVITGVIICAIFIGLIVSVASKATSPKKEVTVSSKSVLYIDLQNRIHEQGEENQFAFFTNESVFNPGLFDMLRALEHAKTDDNVKGIVLRLNPSPNGWATLQQLKKGIEDFKESGKFVYAYGEIIPQNAYYVATAADSIYLNPVGAIELKGFATILAFFKGTLDKLEIEPEIFYAGKFKSATEPLRLTKMSEENRKQIKEFQDDFWSGFVTAVGNRTGKDSTGVATLAETGAIEFPEDALKYKLVDGLKYSDQVESLIREQIDISEDDDIKFVQIAKYADKVKTTYKKGGEKIAVLYAEGSIVSGESDDAYQIASKNMVAAIRTLRKDDNVKAVVMRVNSPGGSALASEVILRELQLLKKEKPLVVSMGDVAASGGYYISCYADSIYVMPNTITGSIGVFGMMFNTQKLMNNKLGITFDEVKNAQYADFPSGVRPLTQSERNRVQNSIDHIYVTFKTHVSKGRKMSMEAVDLIAQGRIWTGTDALNNGLADAEGDLDRAVSGAAALAGVNDYSVVTYPEPIDRLGNMLKKMSGSEATTRAIQTAIEGQLGEEYKFIKQIKDLKEMNGQAMTLLPFSIEVR